jgi:alanine racemase
MVSSGAAGFLRELGQLITKISATGVTVEELAAWSGTIPYEVLCGFSVRVPRR